MTILYTVLGFILWYTLGVFSMIAVYLKQNRGELSLSELVTCLFMGILGVLLMMGIVVGAALQKFQIWHAKAKYKIIYRSKSAKVYELLFGKKDK